jgi:hypothetical protein
MIAGQGKSKRSARMRAAVRPFVLFAVLVTFTTAVQSQGPGAPGGPGPGGGGVNQLLFGAGSPNPAPGGVGVTMSVLPTTGYTCKSVTIFILDQNSKQLATATINNPGPTFTQTFAGLPSGITVTVNVESVFQSGAQFDFPSNEATTTTK